MTEKKIIGRYEVLDELGRGAMGSVLRANDPLMNRTVAIKTILASALDSEHGAEFRKRFIREAQAAGVLTHPGIVAVYDVGEHEGSPFLVMEFVQGRTLDVVLKKGDRLSLERIVEVGSQIADALNFAHRNGVVHRDIKPANILMTDKSIYGFERPKITDFGVAKLAVGDITTTGQMLGTPAFMPPEQFTGAPIDGRTDLFSLGVILYQMVTGEQPFPGETMTSVSYKIVHTDPIPPSKLNPTIPVKLDGIILKCLAKSPADRFQTGEELARELTALTGPSESMTTSLTPIVAAIDPDQTLDSGTMNRANLGIAANVAKSQQTPAQKKFPLLLAALGAAFALVVVGAAFFILHSKKAETSAQQIAPSSVTTTSPVTIQTAQNAQASKTPAQTNQAKPTAGHASNNATSAPTPDTTAKAEAAPQPVSPSANPASSKVAFDPLKLDPKQNAHVKIDLNHFAPGIAFTIYFNDAIFYQGTSDKHPNIDKLYAPLGVQHMRVEVSSGGVKRSSNLVSAEFVAKKHMNLKIEIRPPSKPTPGVTTALDPAAQVIATLKQGFSLFN